MFAKGEDACNTLRAENEELTSTPKMPRDAKGIIQGM